MSRLFVLAVLLLQAASTPKFDVASVKVHTGGGGTTRRTEQQSLTFLNVTLGEFIQIAYDVKHYQIEGPEWVVNYGSSSRYDIVAKAAAPASERELHAMLRSVLIERFHLTLHRETRVLPVYALVVDKGGPKFKEGDGGDSSVSRDPSGGARYVNYPMAGLAATLSVMPSTGRPVLDRTGLTGRYTFSANLFEIPAGLGVEGQKIAEAKAENPAFTTLREQLGLKLEPDRAPIEMLVVDRADRVPTDD
ncbi:MAG TPA: TIGR03435 family protein [Vicinamibacterales bacterium]|nr:TIGR03435 family protein [Vicinamibacterales bacterium]